MKLADMVRLTAGEPVFSAGLLISGDVDPRDVRRQLSRWKDAGKVIQLRKGVYALAEPFRSVKPHPFVIANRLVKGSYVSLQSALAWYEMIPENVPVTTSVTTLRPGSWETPLGTFSYRHLKPDAFNSFLPAEVSPGQWAAVATREKALCDLVHLTPGSDSARWVREMRLRLDELDGEKLQAIVSRSGSAKLERAYRIVQKLLEAGEDGSR